MAKSPVHGGMWQQLAPTRSEPSGGQAETLVILDRMKHLLQERGWCQGRAQDGRGRLSIEAALDIAASERAVSERERIILAARTRNQLCRCAGTGALSAWNDARSRRRGDINELVARARFLNS